VPEDRPELCFAIPVKDGAAHLAETLDQGMRILDDAIGRLSGRTIPGETVFKLYDTYGFPTDLTADVARERDLGVDMAGFEAACAAVTTGGTRLGMTMAREKWAAEWGRTPLSISPSRRCRCQSSGRLSVKLVMVLPLACARHAR